MKRPRPSPPEGDERTPPAAPEKAGGAEAAGPSPASAQGGAEAARGPGADPEEHDWIRRAQAGDEGAFEALVRRHQARAQRIARAMVGSEEDARDLVQEAFLRVFRSLGRFDFEHGFGTWLHRIVTNLAIDHLRKRRQVASTSSSPDEEGPGIELEDPDAPPPSRDLESRETAERVRACIESLAPHFQAVLVLRELEGLACTEIARIVGATHVTVRWRLHRGRKLFQEEWERRERLAERESAARALANRRPPASVVEGGEDAIPKGPDET